MPLIRTLLLAAAVCLAALPQAGQARDLDTVMKTGSLRIGVYRDLPPFSSMKDGRLVGIDVDIGAEIARRLGVSVSYMQLTADENIDDDLRNGVWKGSVLGGGGVADVMLHMPVDRELNIRNDLVVLFGAYHREEFRIARDPVRTKGIETLAVYATHKIGVELDTLPDFYLSGAFGGQLRRSVVHYPTVEAAVVGLVDGEVAGVMAPASQLEAGLVDHHSRFEIAAAPTPGLGKGAWDVGMAVKHTYRALGYAVGDIIDAMETDGTLKTIFAAHGVTWRPPEH